MAEVITPTISLSAEFCRGMEQTRPTTDTNRSICVQADALKIGAHALQIVHPLAISIDLINGVAPRQKRVAHGLRPRMAYHAAWDSHQDELEINIKRAGVLPDTEQVNQLIWKGVLTNPRRPITFSGRKQVDMMSYLYPILVFGGSNKPLS